MVLRMPSGQFRISSSVDLRLHRIQGIGEPAVQGGAVLAREQARGPDLCSQQVAERCPAVVRLGLLAQLMPDELDHLVGQDSDEEVALRALVLLVKDGAQPQLRLQGPEDGVHVGKHEVGPPQLFRSELLHFGAQSVHAGICEHRVGLGIQRPSNLHGISAFIVGLDRDCIVLRRAARGLLEPPMRSWMYVCFLRVRGFESPSEISLSCFSKRAMRRFTMASSFCTRTLLRQYTRVSSSPLTSCSCSSCPERVCMDLAWSASNVRDCSRLTTR